MRTRQTMRSLRTNKTIQTKQDKKSSKINYLPKFKKTKTKKTNFKLIYKVHKTDCCSGLFVAKGETRETDAIDAAKLR